MPECMLLIPIAAPFFPLQASEDWGVLSCARCPFITTWLKPLMWLCPVIQYSLWESTLKSEGSKMFNWIPLVPLKALFSWIQNEKQRRFAACSDIFCNWGCSTQGLYIIFLFTEMLIDVNPLWQQRKKTVIMSFLSQWSIWTLKVITQQFLS